MPTFRQDLKSRFAIFAAIILVVLGVLVVKLWTMQVLNGKAYAQQAEDNRIREITSAPTRGRILDRNGVELVTNRPTLAVYVDPRTQSDADLLRRLSTVLGMPASEIKERAASQREEAIAPRLVTIDVPMKAAAYLAEHQAEFPGVKVEATSVRRYPQGRLAAQVLGYAGEISEAELLKENYEGYHLGDVVGKSGAEEAFESVLQGDRGLTRFEVTAQGVPRRVVQRIEPVPGRDVQLTIDSRIQKVAEQSLAAAMRDAHREKFPKARAGAAVVMDVKTGEVLAMASLPTYDPSVFIGGVSKKNWASLMATSNDFPLTNRAIMGQYPAASTFKAFSGTAGLVNGVTSAGTTAYCEGKWIGMGKEWSRWCWNHGGHGTETLIEGFKDSCDVVFYEIGHALYKKKGEPLQASVRTFGFGKPTGVELPGEAPGRVPDAKWKKEFNADYPEYQQWNPGDTVAMAIGQGDLLVTPLQLAVGYSAVANGGKVLRPHVLKSVRGGAGAPGLAQKPEVVSKVKASPAQLGVVRQGLREVITNGTGRSAFADFGIPIAGKTGTGEVAGKDDYALFVGYAPATNPKYCVAVVVEQGGHGGSVAAPAVRDILAALFNQPIKHVTAQDNSR